MQCVEEHVQSWVEFGNHIHFWLDRRIKKLPLFPPGSILFTLETSKGTRVEECLSVHYSSTILNWRWKRQVFNSGEKQQPDQPIFRLQSILASTVDGFEMG